jgi:transposase
MRKSESHEYLPPLLDEKYVYVFKTPSTPYFSIRNGVNNVEKKFKIQESVSAVKSTRKHLLLQSNPNEFESFYNEVMTEFKSARPLRRKRKKNSQCRKFSKSEKDRIRVCNYVDGGCKNAKEISTQIKRSQPWVRYVIKSYCSSGRAFAKQRGPKKRLTGANLKYIKDFYTKKENATKTLMDLKENFLREFNLSRKFVGISTLWRAVNQLRFTSKKLHLILYKKNTRSNIRSRYNLALTLLQSYHKKQHLIYIDETGFNMNQFPRRGFAPVNTKACIYGSAKSQNFSVVAAMDKDGILGFMVFIGGLTGSDYFGFLNKMLATETGRLGGEDVVFFMDNAPIHRTNLIKARFVREFPVIYNASYTPEMNPIEYAFSKIKRRFRLLMYQRPKLILENIIESFSTTTREDCRGYIRRSLHFIRKAFLREEFF